MLMLDHKKGGGKKPYKAKFFFGHPLLERRKRVKRKERPEVKKNTIFCTVFWGALETGRK